MPDGTFVKEIRNLVDEHTKKFEIDGRTYSTKQLYLVDKPSEKVPAAIQLGTLKGLADYINATVDIPADEELYVRIVSPQKIEVHSKLFGDHCQRKAYVTCIARGVEETRFNQFMGMEEAIILLRTYFEENEDRQKILALISKVTEKSEVTTTDDGLGQEIEVREGISRTGTEEVPDVLMLKPYRTFAEVDQPASPYIVRMRKGPQVAFFASQSPSWQIEAVNNITGYLKDAIKRENTFIIA